ncbi:MAG TPA: dihydrolipoamide acetyltransferase family protein [Bryobacteraceae bacterium]|jgi:pyruvate dehydrogenase E2 component (dihydrolipoamide acetyltransferase)
MTHDIVMPQLGMTMTEGFVMQWLKKVGDLVEKGEPLFIVETDKVDMDVESPYKGYVSELVVEEKLTVAVGTVIARLSESMEEKPGKLRVSPRARRVAEELGVGLNGLAGTGEGGRIREVDVRGARPTAKAATAPARRRIAERLEESVRTVPQFYVRREVDASQLTLVREQLLPPIEKRDGVRLSFTDFLLRALALALRDVAGMNSVWRDGALEECGRIDVGFAAQSPGQLLVPVIRDAAGLSLSKLAQRRADLAARAKAGKLLSDEMQGGSATLSNLGAFGIDEFDAIINPPESCILAAGRIAPRPFVADGQLVARPTLKLTLTVDHRVADGVLAATFLNAVAKSIEQPATLLV